MFFDTDCGGVVHNIAYLRWIETARTRLAASMGMRLSDMATDQRFPVVLRTEINYRKPARLGDWINVSGHLEQLERVRFWCAFEVTRESDGARLVDCRQSLALVQMPEGRPLRLPEDWNDRFLRAGA
ncbi:tol-pal system-associated acyl-CoA thioesterase [soil metagenome]